MFMKYQFQNYNESQKSIKTIIFSVFVIKYIFIFILSLLTSSFCVINILFTMNIIFSKMRIVYFIIRDLYYVVCECIGTQYWKCSLANDG